MFEISDSLLYFMSVMTQKPLIQVEEKYELSKNPDMSYRSKNDMFQISGLSRWSGILYPLYKCDLNYLMIVFLPFWMRIPLVFVEVLWP